MTDLDRRALEHAPRTIGELRAAAQAMLRDGLTDNDVARVLRLDVAAVRRLVGECLGCGE